LLAALRRDARVAETAMQRIALALRSMPLDRLRHEIAALEQQLQRACSLLDRLSRDISVGSAPTHALY
jgi:hypothetical protein